MSAGYTPGPWQWAKARNGRTYIYDANGRVIARVFRPEGMPVEEQRANAALLQAAVEPKYTAADVTDAHAKGYALGLAQKARPTPGEGNG